MARERKTKAVVYKRANFHVSGPVLQHALQGALDALPTVGERREGVSQGGDSHTWRVVGQFRVETHFVFGVLMRYVPGLNPAYVVDDEGARLLTVEQYAAPATEEGLRRELVEGMLFFAVTENHLAMLQTLQLRSGQLEQHLQWLLHHGRQVASDNTLRLLDQPPPEVRERLVHQSVKEINIGGDLFDPAPAVRFGGRQGGAPAPAEERSITASHRATDPLMWGLIRQLLPQDTAARLNVDDLAGADLEYTLRVTYKRSTTQEGQRIMDSIGSAFRHAEGVDAKVLLVGGGEFKGDELRITGTVNVDSVDGIPVADNVFEELRTWLLDKVRSGAIPT